MSIVVKGQVFLLSDFFSSVGHLVDGHICVVEEDDEVEEGRLIFKKTEGRGASNWIVLELPKVTVFEK